MHRLTTTTNGRVCVASAWSIDRPSPGPPVLPALPTAANSDPSTVPPTRSTAATHHSAVTGRIRTNRPRIRLVQPTKHRQATSA